MNGQLLSTIIFIFLTSSSHAQTPLTCSPGDLAALKGFAQRLDSKIDGWDFAGSSSPSSPSNCCFWTGVTCLNDSSSDSHGRVVKLELPRRRLFGNISDSLGGLGYLRTLNLTHNYLKGSFPRSLLNLPWLEILDLSHNEISGWFPTTMDLPAIRVLNISENSIMGSVPVWICGNSSKMETLNFADNFFSGNLSRGLGDCKALEELDVSSNFITGGFPDDLFELSGLRKLSLQENRFSGQVSDSLGSLGNLSHIDLSLNELSGSIPDVFDRFGNLRYFSAQSNGFSGEIPTSLSNSRTVETLSLRNNSLGGKIIINCSAMISLVSLNLATNKFHGQIPENLPACPNLKTINFARINFSGQIPESFKNFKSLSYISLSNSSISNISSALETLQNCKNLTTLVLTLNFHNEELPGNKIFQFPRLKTLVIASCRLTGGVPRWLSHSTELQLLDLSWNRLEGSIPPWFGDFGSLFYLDLSNNSLTGEIPRELTGLRSLVYGNISVEEPTPDFPFFVRRNLSGFRYKQVVSFPPTIELGNNYLTGPIWPEFGNLIELHVLELKCNNLTGPIPSELARMRSLETLDLSFNGLNGTIPPSLTGLSFLSKFSVAYNSLTGPIPTGPQFSSFPNSSFEGNPGLCGEHGPKPCVGDEARSSEDGHGGSKGSRNNAAVGMGVGFGVASAVILAVVFSLYACSCPRNVVVDPEADVIIAGKNEGFEDGPDLVVLCENTGCHKEIFLEDLLTATSGFDQSHIIGCGGFGLVYSAVLTDGTKLAIKRLSGEFLQIEREFKAEIETLSRARHPNLVQLQGYCKYKDHRLLIYSYMENGSLDYWLHEKPDGPASLDWEARLRIARGALAGLHYLHQSCEPRILHRDVKSSNILLDGEFEARLADFGLARLMLPYDTHVTTDLVGTLGYIPPEYGQASVATYKGDVYSFGVVLLELLTGKRPFDVCRAKEGRELVPWVNRMRGESRAREVFDPFVYDKEHDKDMVRVLEIACLCLSENPKARPGTEELVSWLGGIGSVINSISR